MEASTFFSTRCKDEESRYVSTADQIGKNINDSKRNRPRGLIRNPLQKSPWSIAVDERITPQVGQGIPVNLLKTHSTGPCSGWPSVKKAVIPKADKASKLKTEMIAGFFISGKNILNKEMVEA